MAGLLDWVDPAREKFIGLLSGMPISRAIRGDMGSSFGQALREMPVFDKNAKVEDQSAFWNPAGLLGAVKPIKGAVVLVNDKVYLGNTHADAINKAIYEGAITRNPTTKRLNIPDSFSTDYFMTHDGKIIDRLTADSLFNKSGAEDFVDAGMMSIGPSRRLNK